MAYTVKVSRREFIKDAAVAGAAAATAGMLGVRPAAAAPIPPKWDKEADVVIIGYGGGGAVTAITAHDAGAKVLILEKQPDDTATEIRHTPSTRNAGGGLTVWVGSEEDGLKFVKWATGEMVADDVIKAYVAKWVDSDKWITKMGGTPDVQPRGLMEFPKDAPGFAAGESWRSLRYDKVLANSSVFAWRLFEKNVRETRKIEILFETPGKRLVVDPATDQVLGVEAESGGKPLFVRAKKAVVLATGGFEQNEEMKKEAFRGAHFEFYANPANTGEGLKMAVGAGADLWHMFCASGRIAIARFPGTPAGTQITLTTGKGGAIVVDQYGRRYGDEVEMGGGHASWAEAVELDTLLAEYPRIPSWYIFDEGKRLAGPLASGTTKGTDLKGSKQYWVEWSKDNAAEVTKGWILKGATLEELVAKIKLDPDNKSSRVPTGRMDLKTANETVAKFNQYCAAGQDAEFHRPKETLLPLNTPPYYAIKIFPGGPNTWGGPRKNGKCQVVRPDGSAIKGLYVVGELGSIDTLSYPVNNFLEIMITGRIAGENAAKETAV